MIRRADYFQIVWRVVGRVFVAVVHMLSRQGTGNNAMLVTPHAIFALDLDVAAVSARSRADWLTRWMPVFFKSLRPAFAPVFTAMTWDEFRISRNLITGWRDVRRYLFFASARTDFDNSSGAAKHDSPSGLWS